MKKTNWMKGLAAAAVAVLALAGCQKSSPQKSAERGPVQFTVDLSEAGTKGTMALTEKGSLQFALEPGDKMDVVWNNADDEVTADTYEVFEVTEIVDGKATLSNESSALVSAGTQTVGVYYPSRNTPGASGVYYDFYTGNNDQQIQDDSDFSAESAANVAVYGAWGIEVKDGAFPDFGLEQLTAFLKIPSTIPFVGQPRYPYTVLIKASKFAYNAYGYPDEFYVMALKYSGSSGSNGAPLDLLETGALAHDLYIGVLPADYTGQTMTVTVGNFTKDIAGRKIEAGKVYDLTDVLTGE